MRSLDVKWRETKRGRLATAAGELSDRGEPARALVLLEQALALKPGDPVLLTYQGRVLRALGRGGEAERVLRGAIDVDEGLVHAWNELGMLMEEREEFEEAASCFEQSAKRAPNRDVLTMLANMQLAFDPRSSVENAERALALDPEWEEARRVLASAKRELRRLRSEGPSGESS